MAFPYVGNYIYIKSDIPHPFQAFVTKYSNAGGSDDWFNVPDEFSDAGRWSRNNWELAAIRNEGDTHRVGAYVSANNQTVYITIKGVTDLEIVYSPMPY